MKNSRKALIALNKQRNMTVSALKSPIASSAMVALFLLNGAAYAADLPSTLAPPSPPPTSGFSGPLASFAAPLAARGITFNAGVLDFFGDNPSEGLQRGRGYNVAYIFEGVDLDLGKLANISGMSLHFQNTFFAGVLDLNTAAQYGDSQIGYPPPFTPRVARLSRATIEQTFADGKGDVEVGITHPGYYFARFDCGTYNACFQDILYIDAGYTSYTFSVPGGRVSYNITPTVYVEAGAFANQPGANAHIGYDFSHETYNGVLSMAEIGAKTSYATDLYPFKAALTGYYNNAQHTNSFAVAAVPVTGTHSGTSGIVVQGEKVVWRRDGGLNPGDASPTAIRVYGSFGTSLDTTVAIQEDAWLGVTLSAPFATRPADYYGAKVYWERLNNGYNQYLNASYIAAGGTPGLGYNRDSYTFELSAHLALPLGAAFEPVVDYTVNPNSYWNPASATRTHQGVYIGGTVSIPLGVILGIEAAT